MIAWATVAVKKTSALGKRPGDDELAADNPGEKPDDRLGQAADADDAARGDHARADGDAAASGGRQRVLRQAGNRARHQPRRGPAAQRDVDDGHEHEVDQLRAGGQKACKRGLQCQRDGNGRARFRLPSRRAFFARLRRRRFDDQHFLEPVEIDRRAHADRLVDAVAVVDTPRSVPITNPLG